MKKNMIKICMAIILYLSICFPSEAIGVNPMALQWKNLTELCQSFMMSLKDFSSVINVIIPLKLIAIQYDKESSDSLSTILKARELLEQPDSESLTNYIINEIVGDFNFFLPPLFDKYDAMLKEYTYNKLKFRMIWHWLHIHKNGVSLVPQEEITTSIVDNIIKFGVAYPILKIVFRLDIEKPEIVNRSPFRQKSFEVLRKNFPTIDIDESEFIWYIFPPSNTIPVIMSEIIRLTQE